jgi:serine/threonine protein kinase
MTRCLLPQPSFFVNFLLVLHSLTEFLPFYDKHKHVLFNKIKNVEYDWNDCPETSLDAKDFIAHLLVRDAKSRLTAEQALQHRWIRVNGQCR